MNKQITPNSDRFAFSLGLFLVVMIDQVTPDEGAFRADVMAIMGALKKRHLKEERQRNQNYFKAVAFAGEAYRRAMDEMTGTDVTINATIAIIFMQHKELLRRVYGLNGNAIESLTKSGIQTNVMDSVRVSNCFMKHLKACYGVEEITKKKVRMVA
jgi:hypothetical protein